MWPFSVLRRHKYELRYRAARLMMLGQYTYSRLSPEQQRAVRERTRQYMTMVGVAWPVKRLEQIPERFHSPYVVAMKSLGIPPAAAGEQWDIPDQVVMQAVGSRKRFVSGPMMVGSANYRILQFVNQLYFNYHYADPAAEAARRDLIARGADIEAMELGTLNERVYGGDGRLMTQRESWLRHLPPPEK